MSTRCVFLKSSGLALVSFGAVPHFLTRTAEAATAKRGKTLVVLFQRGACDRLNTVVPYGESAYRSLSPSIGVPPPNRGREGALDLDGFFGLHPALEPLLPAWREGSLAVVHEGERERERRDTTRRRDREKALPSTTRSAANCVFCNCQRAEDVRGLVRL